VAVRLSGYEFFTIPYVFVAGVSLRMQGLCPASIGGLGRLWQGSAYEADRQIYIYVTVSTESVV
jgi:hypothetical protein